MGEFLSCDIPFSDTLSVDNLRIVNFSCQAVASVGRGLYTTIPPHIDTKPPKNWKTTHWSVITSFSVHIKRKFLSEKA